MPPSDNPYRLGRHRRNKRDYSVLQRCTGKDAGDRLQEEQFTDMGIVLAALHGISEQNEDLNPLVKRRRVDAVHTTEEVQPTVDHVDDEEDRDQDSTVFTNIFLFLSAIFLLLAAEIRIPRLVKTDSIPKVDVDFDSLTDQEYDQLLGFTQADCEELFVAMQIPNRFLLNGPEGALLLVLFGKNALAVTSTNARLQDLALRLLGAKQDV